MRNTDTRARALEFKWREQVTPARLRGKMSEKMFFQMAKMLMHVGDLPWLSNIKEATRVEDLFGKIDFKLESIAELGYKNEMFLILIQIKSSSTGADKFHRLNPDSKIRVIVMNRNTSLNDLRQILDSIYLEELCSRYHSTYV